MSANVSKKYANEMLDRLIELDNTVSSAYYEMGRILSAIDHSKLYETLDYISLGELVEEELSFSSATGHKYMSVYRQLKRLKYNKAEALDLFQTHSFTRVGDVLPSLNMKVGTRGMATRIADLDIHQINFNFTQSQYDELIAALKVKGATIENGRLTNSSSALLKLIRNGFKLAA